MYINQLELYYDVSRTVLLIGGASTLRANGVVAFDRCHPSISPRRYFAYRNVSTVTANNAREWNNKYARLELTRIVFDHQIILLGGIHIA